MVQNGRLDRDDLRSSPIDPNVLLVVEAFADKVLLTEALLLLPTLPLNRSGHCRPLLEVSLFLQQVIDLVSKCHA